eukprot:4381783-Prymnesium_polylepis.1
MLQAKSEKVPQVQGKAKVKSEGVPQVQCKERGCQPVNPVGRWNGFESGRALTFCGQSQRKCHKFNARREGSVNQSNGAMDCHVTVQESAHIGCSVSTDDADGEGDCAGPCDVHSATLQRTRQFQQSHNTP